MCYDSGANQLVIPEREQRPGVHPAELIGSPVLGVRWCRRQPDATRVGVPDVKTMLSERRMLRDGLFL